MTFQERIRFSYSLYNELVTTISITSNASHEVRQTSQYIAELESRIKKGIKNLKSFQPKVERLRSDYEKLRDGSTKRLFSKISGRTDELVTKTSKAEQEYQDALEEQAKAIKNLETSQRNLEEAQCSLSHLNDQAEIHSATVSELDDLYSVIFSLPHAEYPQEITANQEITLLQAQISDLQKQINKESRALKLLTNARKSLLWSQAAIQNAQDADNNKRGPNIEHHLTGLNIVRNAMSTAQLHAMQADSAYTSAQLVQPSIQNMQELKLLEQSFWLGSSYKPGFYRLLDATELTSKIGKCCMEMKPVVDEVGREIRVAKERVQTLGEEKQELEGEMRDILRRARQQVIGQVIEGSWVDRESREARTDEEEQGPIGPPGYSP